MSHGLRKGVNNRPCRKQLESYKPMNFPRPGEYTARAKVRNHSNQCFTKQQLVYFRAGVEEIMHTFLLCVVGIQVIFVPSAVLSTLRLLTPLILPATSDAIIIPIL